MSVRSRLVRCAPVLLVLGSLAPAAAADSATPPRAQFGEAGQFIVDDIVGAGGRASSIAVIGGAAYGGLISYSRSGSASGAGASASANVLQTISIAPVFDVFVARRVSLGVELNGSWMSQTSAGPLPDASTGWGFSVVPRVGYVIPLGAELSLWPRIAIGGSHVAQRGAATSSCGTGELAALELPLVLRVHPRVFLSVEPEVTIFHYASSSSWEGTPSRSSWTRAAVDGYFGAGLIL